MAIILYSEKGSDLTWADFDNNFIDLNTRLSTIESGSSDQTLALTGSNLTISNGNTVNLSGIVAAAGGIQTLSITNQTLSISGGNSIDLSSAIAAGGGIQTLNLSGTALTITGGNTIDLGALISAAAGVQSLSLSGNLISISGSNTIDLSPIVDNTKQSLSLSNGVLSISDGNNVVLPSQSLSLVNNQLSISGGNSVDLSSYVNSAPQTMTLDGTTLQISGGNSIDLTPIVNLASANGGTDSQTLTLNGSQLSISGGNTIDLSTVDIVQNLTLSNNILGITNGNTISLSPYKQTLSVSGSNIAISGGNSINISTIVDNAVTAALASGNTGSGSSTTGFTLDTETNIMTFDGYNVDLSHYSNTDEQLLYLSGSTLTISNGNSINLAGLLGDATTNAVQSLSLTGNNLSISGGNTVNLSSILDSVTAPTLSLVGNNLSISGGNTIDLTPFKDEVKQTLALNGSKLSISGGNQIDLAPLINSTSGSTGTSGNATVSFNSETNILTIDNSTVNLSQYVNSDEQLLSLQGGMLTITNGNSVDLGSLITQINSGNTYNYNDLINKPTSILDFGVTDGSAGQVLVTDGNGNFSFESMSSGGSSNLVLNGNVLSIVGGNSVDLSSIVTSQADLTDYYTKQEIDSALSNVSTASTLDEVLTNGNETDKDIVTSGRFMTYAYVNTDNGSIIAGAVDGTDDWGFITDTATYSADYGTITLADGTTGTLQPVDVLELANAYADALLANASGATSINDLTDVETAAAGHTPTDGQALVWNAAHGHWMPGTVSVQNTNTESTFNVTTTAQTTFDSWSMDTYRSADYHITVSSATGFSMLKLSVLHDGTNIYTDMYSSIGSDTGDLNISAEGGNVVFKFTPTSAPTEIKFVREAITNSGVHSGGGTGSNCQSITFPLDLQLDSLGVLDLADGSGTIDLSTGENTGVVCDGAGGSTSNCQSITFPVDLQSDSLGTLDLTDGTGTVDLQTGENTAVICDGSGAGTGGGTTGTFDFPANLNTMTGTFDAMNGTGNIDLESGINTGVFN